jgi:ribosomal protein S18 acetylase RimI-like enzyme
MAELRIVEAHGEEGIAAARGLFLEYAERLGIDLCFQGFDRELAELPGDYAPPGGRLLLAIADERHTVACVALRELEQSVCEMKRLYVRPSHRGAGLGRRLAEAVIAEARSIGYERMRLDTLLVMHEAQRLYESLGFREIEPYYPNPIPGARFMELEL